MGRLECPEKVLHSCHQTPSLLCPTGEETIEVCRGHTMCLGYHKEGVCKSYPVLPIIIWSGAVMTATHRHARNPDQSPICRCGEAEETLEHIMWVCPLHARDRPQQLMWWMTLPPAISMSLILPRSEGRAFMETSLQMGHRLPNKETSRATRAAFAKPM